MSVTRCGALEIMVTGTHHGVAEFDLIARIRARAATREDVILGIGDDAALLQVAAGKHLVVATDTLNAGVHFPHDTAPADIGWKSLAVNLSDLAAMGSGAGLVHALAVAARRAMRAGWMAFSMVSSPWPRSTASRWSAATPRVDRSRCA